MSRYTTLETLTMPVSPRPIPTPTVNNIDDWSYILPAAARQNAQHADFTMIDGSMDSRDYSRKTSPLRLSRIDRLFEARRNLLPKKEAGSILENSRSLPQPKTDRAGFNDRA